jgi:hypothetical protein
VSKLAPRPPRYKTATDQGLACDPVHEAGFIFDLMTRGLLTVDQARGLISVNENEMRTLRKSMPHNFADAVGQRLAIRREFDNLLEAKEGRNGRRRAR